MEAWHYAIEEYDYENKQLLGQMPIVKNEARQLAYFGKWEYSYFNPNYYTYYQNSNHNDCQTNFLHNQIISVL